MDVIIPNLVHVLFDPAIPTSSINLLLDFIVNAWVKLCLCYYNNNIIATSKESGMQVELTEYPSGDHFPVTAHYHTKSTVSYTSITANDTIVSRARAH